MGEPAALEGVGCELGAFAFRLEPCLSLPQQLPDLGEQLLRSRALALEGLDPFEPVHHRACFVHALNVATESRRDRVGLVTITRQP
jgi:hypothetical protein